MSGRGSVRDAGGSDDLDSEGRSQLCEGAFSQSDADALARVAPAVAHGIRASLRFDAARRASGTDAPGLIIVGADNAVELMTPPARELIDALGSDSLSYEDGALPATVLSVASF